MNTVQELTQIFAQPLTYVSVGEFNSLTLGFGPISFYCEKSKTLLVDIELCTYHKSWRIIHKNKIYVSGLNLSGELKIQKKIDVLIGAEFVSLRSLTPFDIEIESSSGFVIQLIALPNGIDKELVHVVSRKKDIVTTFYPGKGWKTGPYSSRQTRENSLSCRLIKDLFVTS